MIKTKSTSRVLTLIFILFILMASVLPVSVLAAGGSIYYVSPTGSDTNSGTATSPWQTFAHAVSEMQSGDTLILKDGVYHEELNVSGKSNLTFRAENKGGAVISACDEVSGWTLDSHNIWKAPLDTADVYKGDGNIVFVNGILCQEARWPDLGAGKDGAHPLLNLDNYARVDSGNDAAPTIVDSGLSSLSGLDFTDAYVWCPGGYAYWSYVCPIADFDSSANSILLDSKYFDGSGYYPKKNNIYYIFGSKSLLSTEGEWYRGDDGLYMYHEGESAPTDVEFRVREYTMQVSSAQNITVDGISFRGGIPVIGDDTAGCTVTGCTFDTLDYRMPRKAKTSEGNYRPAARGFVLKGEYNKIVNSEFCNLYGEGILLYGDDNKVLNNYFHDFNFEANYSDGVQAKGGSRHLISHNTFKHFGRSAIGGTFRKTVISYNDISDGGILTRDGGCVYLVNYDFDSSEFHHNVLSNSENGESYQYGFYMDSYSAGLNVYRNLLYGLENKDNSFSLTFVTSYHNIGNLFANNTFVNIGNIDWGKDFLQDHSQTIFVNNIFGAQCTYRDNKLGSERDAYLEYFTGFANAEANDYTLSSTATDAIDKGKHIPGITDRFAGDAPDIGAFEFGEDSWLDEVGHDFNNASYANKSYVLNTRIPYRNLIENSSFEYFTSGSDGEAVFNGWTSDTPVSYKKSNAWNNSAKYTKNGSYSAVVNKGQTLTQLVTGLKPNTVYQIGAYATNEGTADDSEDIALLKVTSDTGDTEEIEFTEVSAMPSQMKTIAITTGSAGTIKVELTKTSGAMSAYFDEVRMRESFTQNVYDKTYLVWDYSLFDDKGAELHSIRKNANHTVKGIIDDINGIGGDVTLTLSSVYKDGTVFETAEKIVTVLGGSVLDFDITVKTPLSEDCYLVFTWENNSVVTTYTLSDFTLNEQYEGDGIFVDDVSIYKVEDGAAVLIPSLLKGEFNMFELALRSNSDEDVEFTGILALYDGVKLIDIITVESVIDADGRDRFWLGTVLPDIENLSIKLFTWNSLDSLTPIVEHKLFQ